MIKFRLYPSAFLCLFTFFSLSAYSVSKTEAQVGIQASLDKIIENLHHPDITPGALIASPSRRDPDYFFHWTRDAGLTILTLTSDVQRTDLPQAIENWGRFERFTQDQAMRPGGPGLGEPKFMVNGDVFTGPWGRPQNDGPAIRSLAFLRAFHKIDKYVEADIAYTLQNWRQPGFDLWEEVKGHHFFTRYAQMTSLRYAAHHYQAGLHSQNARALYKEAAKIEKSLQAFIDPYSHLVTPTLPGSEGVYKAQGIDISVILAINYFGSTAQAHLQSEPDWSYSQPNVLFTANRIRETFKRIYTINQKFSNMAPGIGRYPEDVYDGNGFSGGHPWFLATFGMAEYYCSLVQELIEKGSLSLDPLSRTFYSALNPTLAIRQSGKLSSSQGEFWSTLQSIQNAAASSIERANFHANAEGRYAEQFDRDTGYMRGASDLTWSYASKIRALNRCETSSKMLQHLAK